jgi:hypothetical protein
MDGFTKTNLVIGQGQIGTALAQVLECDSHDIEPLEGHYDIIHITIPYSSQFKKIVKECQERYTPEITVVHSTVPVGTCEKLGACHSPVTGVHPDLAESMKTFTKFVSGEGAEVVVEAMKAKNIPAVVAGQSGNTEAGKLFALLIYGVNVLLEKEIFEYCEKNGLDYQVTYTEFVKMYNQGYEDMGKPHYKMYDLVHMTGGIGGHCVTQNAPLLKTKFAKLLKRYAKRFNA